MNSSLQEKTEGLLIGTAVADSMGLPTEGMTPKKIRQLGWTKNLKHRFLFGKGMWSDDLLSQLGTSPNRGISGYVYQTVPAVILAGLRNNWDFKTTVTELIEAGGDTDTTSAIAGALCGAYGGVSSIPSNWIDNLNEWPTPASRLSGLSSALLEKSTLRIRSRWSPFLLLRNLIFLTIVLLHGFARMLPNTLMAAPRK